MTSCGEEAHARLLPLLAGCDFAGRFLSAANLVSRPADQNAGAVAREQLIDYGRTELLIMRANSKGR
jgi:hypothetical protein